jgi:hypothetical protein
VRKIKPIENTVLNIIWTQKGLNEFANDKLELVWDKQESGGPGSILGPTRKKNVVGLERGPLSLVSTTEELLNRKVADPV